MASFFCCPYGHSLTAETEDTVTELAEAIAGNHATVKEAAYIIHKLAHQILYTVAARYEDKDNVARLAAMAIADVADLHERLRQYEISVAA